MEIKLPSVSAQQQLIFNKAIDEAIEQLTINRNAKEVPPIKEIDESKYPNTHLLREREGWEPPAPDVVGAYFRHFQSHCPGFETDSKLARLLGLSSDRRIRAFKQGTQAVPYGIWRTFLIMTGRVGQDIIDVKFRVAELKNRDTQIK